MLASHRLIGISRESSRMSHETISTPSIPSQTGRLRYLQQWVTVGSPTANSYNENFAALCNVVHYVSSLSPLDVDDRTLGKGEGTLHFSNRVFTLRDEAHGQEPVPITFPMDPDGRIRRSAAKTVLVHTEDNRVEYHRMRPGK